MAAQTQSHEVMAGEEEAASLRMTTGPVAHVAAVATPNREPQLPPSAAVRAEIDLTGDDSQEFGVEPAAAGAADSAGAVAAGETPPATAGAAKRRRADRLVLVAAGNYNKNARTLRGGHAHWGLLKGVLRQADVEKGDLAVFLYQQPATAVDVARVSEVVYDEQLATATWGALGFVEDAAEYGSIFKFTTAAVVRLPNINKAEVVESLGYRRPPQGTVRPPNHSSEEPPADLLKQCKRWE